MTRTFMPLTVTRVVALTPFSGIAFAQTTKTPVVPTAPASPTAARVRIQSPTDWIVYTDKTYTPVADEVSRRLAAADELKAQATRATQAGTTRTTAEMAQAHDAARHVTLTAQKVTAAAVALESGTIKTQADWDKALDKAAWEDMELRWLVTDVTT